MVLYYELDANFQTCSTTKEIIAKIDNIINALLTTALNSVLNGDVVEYKIDTGQTTQNVVYRNPEAITKTIEGYRKIRAMYVRDIIGGTQLIIDSKNLIHKNGYL